MKLRVIYVVSVSLTCINLLLILLPLKELLVREEQYEKIKKSVDGEFPTRRGARS